MAEAARTGQLVELPELRTEGSDTYATGDGHLQTKAYSTPLNFKAADGSWQPIDSTLVPVEGGWRNRAAGYSVLFPTDLASGSVQITRGSTTLSYRLTGASAAKGAVAGDLVTYTDVLPGVSVTLYATARGLKEALVLSDAKATPTAQFALSTNADAKVAAGGDGSVTITGADGTTMSIPAPFAEGTGTDSLAGFDHAVTSKLTATGAAPRRWTCRCRPST